MRIGVPREIKAQESRVALLPAAAYQLTKRGHEVVVERDAGVGAGYADADYERAGARTVDSHEAAFEAELVVKVKEPLPAEYPLLRPGQILFTYLHLAANRELTEALMKSGVTALAYETVQLNNRLPLLEPMSEIAGRMSVIVGGYFLAKHCGGKGVLLGGVPGVLPGKVVVIGGGASGVNAARMAHGTRRGRDDSRGRSRADAISRHHACTRRTRFIPARRTCSICCRTVDLLIGAVLVPGAKAPKLISREMLRQMRPGSVLVDIAIDQGGCAETSRATTHDDAGVRRGRRDSLLRGEHAGGVCAHGHAGAHERDLSLHRSARRFRI